MIRRPKSSLMRLPKRSEAGWREETKAWNGDARPFACSRACKHDREPMTWRTAAGRLFWLAGSLAALWALALARLLRRLGFFERLSVCRGYAAGRAGGAAEPGIWGAGFPMC